jgi:hypothetical protein
MEEEEQGQRGRILLLGAAIVFVTVLITFILLLFALR